jgi:hypothetical protein
VNKPAENACASAMTDDGGDVDPANPAHPSVLSAVDQLFIQRRRSWRRRSSA